MSFSFTGSLVLLRLFSPASLKITNQFFRRRKLQVALCSDRAAIGDSDSDMDAFQSHLLATYNNQARLVRSMEGRRDDSSHSRTEVWRESLERRGW